jgi:hypothetical protein
LAGVLIGYTPGFIEAKILVGGNLALNDRGGNKI